MSGNNGQKGNIRTLPADVVVHRPEGNLGVLKIVGDTQLPKEFITVGRDFDEALGRTSIADDSHLAAIIELKQQLIEFEMFDELEHLISYLNGRPAIGGFQRIQAIMAHTGVMFPEALGIKLSKRGTEVLKAQNKVREEERSRRDQAPS